MRPFISRSRRPSARKKKSNLPRSAVSARWTNDPKSIWLADRGSVQTVVQTGPNSALRLTTARYYTPSGRSVQAGGIDPDITVPQLSDEDYKDRPRIREADLRRHLLAQAGVDDKLLESDNTPDPRFAATAAELERRGVKDFQLYYAINTLRRLARPAAPATVAQKRSR